MGKHSGKSEEQQNAEAEAQRKADEFDAQFEANKAARAGNTHPNLSAYEAKRDSK